jgi:sugar (pentulose or hexulose) kinase
LRRSLGLPVDLPADGDFGAAFGAARLGLIAAEKADPLAICTRARDGAHRSSLTTPR